MQLIFSLESLSFSFQLFILYLTFSTSLSCSRRNLFSLQVLSTHGNSRLFLKIWILYLSLWWISLIYKLFQWLFSIFCPVQTSHLHASSSLSSAFHTGDMWPWPFSVARFTVEYCKFTVVGKTNKQTNKKSKKTKKPKKKTKKTQQPTTSACHSPCQF